MYSLRNCTSYAAWEINTVFDVDINGWGNAADWDTNATGTGHPYTNDSSPKVGDIAQWNATTGNPYGHVAYVWQVNGTTATFAEYNYAGTGSFTSSYTSSTHGSAPDHYIHIGNLNDIGWWASTSGVNGSRSQVAAVGTSDGGEDMFIVSSTGALQQKYWTSGSGWSSWINVGAPSSPLETISVILNPDGHWDVYGLSDNGHLYQDDYRSGSGWGGWIDHGAPSSPINGFTAKIYPTDLSQFIYATSANGHLWQINWTSSGGWGSWIDRGAPSSALIGTPSEMITSDEDIYIYAISANGHLWQKSWSSGVWGNFLDRGAPSSALTNSPSTVLSSNGNIDIYAVSSSDGHLWQKNWVKATGTWSSWTDIESAIFCTLRKAC